MDPGVSRAIAGVALISSLGVGGWTGLQLTTASGATVDELMSSRITVEQAQRQALAAEASYAGSETMYMAHVDDAVREHGVTAPSRERLLAPNPVFRPASPSKPKKIANESSWTVHGLKIQVVTEIVETELRGIRTKNQHTIAKLENVGTEPFAYYVDLHAGDNVCKVRTLSRFNAMALLPGEKGEISICAGVHEVEVRDLRIMHVTELGALWVSKVPALAVGYDSVVARSHTAGRGVDMCAELPANELAGKIEDGVLAWEDLIDFFSRHDCEHYRWFASYRRADAPLTQLPVREHP
jgi:hypothetical protein